MIKLQKNLSRRTGLNLKHSEYAVSHNNSKSQSISVPTPAGVPQRAAWASSLSQAPPGHQASWQPFSWSRNDIFLLLLLHGMAVVPLTELWTALDTNILPCTCQQIMLTARPGKLKWQRGSLHVQNYKKKKRFHLTSGTIIFNNQTLKPRPFQRLKHKLIGDVQIADTHMCHAGSVSSCIFPPLHCQRLLHMLQSSHSRTLPFCEVLLKSSEWPE